MVNVSESGMNKKSSMSSTIMQTLTLITLVVSEKILMLKVSTNPGTWLTKNMLNISLEYTPELHKSH